MAQDAEAERDVQLDVILRSSVFEIREVARLLDALSPEARLAQVCALSRGAQAILHEAAKGARKSVLEDLVPAAVAPLTQVVHEGRNSLPMFRRFAKVFARPKPGARELWGYNRTNGLIRNGVGPGYFVAYEGPGDEVLIDYTRVPEDRLPGWPPVLRNEARLGRFVYAGMVDALRAVSRYVTVGRAIRNGKVQDNWFVLCRMD
ncbi:MAG: hypothetical protein ABW252_07805 [Polyangiales bacterium]